MKIDKKINVGKIYKIIEKYIGSIIIALITIFDWFILYLANMVHIWPK